MDYIKQIISGDILLQSFQVLMWLWPLFCIFERDDIINTRNPVRVFGYFTWCIGAVVWWSGTFNFIMIFGVIVVALTYVNEIYDRLAAKGKITKRRNDPVK